MLEFTASHQMIFRTADKPDFDFGQGMTNFVRSDTSTEEEEEEEEVPHVAGKCPYGHWRVYLIDTHV